MRCRTWRGREQTRTAHRRAKRELFVLTQADALRIRRPADAPPRHRVSIRASPLRAEQAAGECPERQRGRTVNPLAKPSQVRVLLPPPLLNKRGIRGQSLGFEWG